MRYTIKELIVESDYLLKDMEERYKQLIKEEKIDPNQARIHYKKMLSIKVCLQTLLWWDNVEIGKKRS